jgi:hypothetical protein
MSLNFRYFTRTKRFVCVTITMRYPLLYKSSNMGRYIPTRCGRQGPFQQEYVYAPVPNQGVSKQLNRFTAQKRLVVHYCGTLVLPFLPPVKLREIVPYDEPCGFNQRLHVPL